MHNILFMGKHVAPSILWRQSFNLYHAKSNHKLINQKGMSSPYPRCDVIPGSSITWDTKSEGRNSSSSSSLMLALKQAAKERKRGRNRGRGRVREKERERETERRKGRGEHALNMAFECCSSICINI